MINPSCFAATVFRPQMWWPTFTCLDGDQAAASKRSGRPIFMLQRVLTQDPGTMSACFGLSQITQLFGTVHHRNLDPPYRPHILNTGNDHLTIYAAGLRHEWSLAVKAPSSSYASNGSFRHHPKRCEQTIEAQDHHSMPEKDQGTQGHIRAD